MATATDSGPPEVDLRSSPGEGRVGRSRWGAGVPVRPSFSGTQANESVITRTTATSCGDVTAE